MELKFILESILFSAQQPMSPKDLRAILRQTAEESEEAEVKAFKKTSLDDIEAILADLEQEHADANRSYRLACVAGAWQFASQPEYAPWIKTLVGHKPRPPRLSQPALETLAIVAYRQPITRAEMEQVRGVAVDGVVQTLQDRGLIEQIGRAEVPGRPMTYGTTELFLQYFGIGSLEDLPAADDLRRIPVVKPEGLMTVDHGLATAPPEQLRLSDPAERDSTEPGSSEDTNEATPSDSEEASRESEDEASAADAGTKAAESSRLDAEDEPQEDESALPSSRRAQSNNRHA